MPSRSLLLSSLGVASTAALLSLWSAACGEGPVSSDVTTTGVPAGASGAGGSGGEGGGSVASSSGAGGASPCDAATSTCPCKLQGECAEGALCVEGLCINPCDFSYQCGPGKVCANGECVLQCDGAGKCDPGYKCTKGICIPDPASPQCSPQKPCQGAGEICVGGLCTTPCAVNADCPDGEVCEWSSGSCINNPSAKPVCTMNNECTSASPQLCGGDGFCHFICDPSTGDMGVAQCKAIDSRFIKCDKGVCKTDEEVNPECTTQKPCPEVGKDCISNKCL